MNTFEKIASLVTVLLFSPILSVRPGKEPHRMLVERYRLGAKHYRQAQMSPMFEFDI
jgi:hypothetical protein